MKGNICISKMSPSNEVRIWMEDDISSTNFLEIRMCLENFAKALFGQGNIECEFELHPQFVGMKREVKMVDVYVPEHAYKDMASVRLAVAVHEVDGWMGRAEDAVNHHNLVKNGNPNTYSVLYVRYVREQ